MKRAPKMSATRTVAAFDAADREIVIGLEQNSQATNYLAWLAALCSPHLGATCLEIGSGYGDLTERLQRGSTVYATEVSDRSLARLNERFAGNGNVVVRRFDVVHDDLDRSFDTIVMINVLEHIEDDARVLRRLHDLLVPGGRLVAYVPAFRLLYSEFDRQIGHFRRYRKRELLDLMSGAGFRITDARYVNSVGALGWFVYCRLLRRKASDGVTVNGCDRYVVPVVRRLESRVRPPFGISLLAVGERPKE